MSPNYYKRSMTIADYLDADARDRHAAVRYMRETGCDNAGEAMLAVERDEDLLQSVDLKNRAEHWVRTGEWR